MRYREFISASQRADKLSNDKTHFFSSLASNQIAYFLYKLNLTPNMATFLFLFLGVSSGLSLIFDAYMASYLLWRLHIIVDMADGIIARATSRFSKSAMGFDRSNHIIINLLFLSGASASVNHYIQYFLICSFLLTYMFSRNYFTEKQGTMSFTYKKIVLKNVIGLEGFVFLSTIGCLVFDLAELDGTVQARSQK